MYFFQMITFVCEMYPEKICQQSLDLLKSILITIELGLTAFGQDVTTLCCDFIQSLGSYLHRAHQHGSPAYHALRPFLKVSFIVNIVIMMQHPVLSGV